MQDNVMIEWQQWQNWWSVTDYNSWAVGRPSCKSGQEAGCCLIAKLQKWWGGGLLTAEEEAAERFERVADAQTKDRTEESWCWRRESGKKPEKTAQTLVIWRSPEHSQAFMKPRVSLISRLGNCDRITLSGVEECWHASNQLFWTMKPWFPRLTHSYSSWRTEAARACNKHKGSDTKVYHLWPPLLSACWDSLQPQTLSHTKAT